MINYLPIQLDSKALSQYTCLLSKCFQKTAKFRPSYLDWLYRKNPDGEALGFDAWDGDRLVAHYVCVPTLASVGGKVVKVLLSLNTATHPEYQGRRLFTTLAEMTYAEATAKDFDCVYGVANANSTLGFVHKLGFQLVQPLDARIGIGRLSNQVDASASKVQFERVWSAESLNWRCANPFNPVFHRSCGNWVQFHAAALGKLLPVYDELSSANVPEAWNGDAHYLLPWRLYMGIVPEGAIRFQYYVSIPQRLRPSPLNLIYRSLSHRLQVLEIGHIRFSFLDFDAY